MTTKKPPVPPANRSSKGGDRSPPDQKRANPASKKAEDTDQVGDRANIRQNTTNQDFKHRR